uniref:Uncharacterized protein n=1 Tax=Aegilops tauschii subsp. strangulata TaxID=200361 RepID=A0A453M3N0_AEGTS
MLGKQHGGHNVFEKHAGQYLTSWPENSNLSPVSAATDITFVHTRWDVLLQFVFAAVFRRYRHKS